MNAKPKHLGHADELPKEYRVCECCKKTLKGKIAWLELDQRTNEYHDFGGIPNGFSQGWFHFGLTCARKLNAEFIHTQGGIYVSPELAISNLPQEGTNELMLTPNSSLNTPPALAGNAGGVLKGECPRCGDKDCERYHHIATYPAPECWSWECPTCAHQWGHE